MKKIMVIFASLAVAGAASAGIIGVNSYSANAADGWDGGAGQLTGAEAFGVSALGTVQTNWNNSTFGNKPNLIWDDGTVSSVGLSGFNGPNGNYTTWNGALANTAWRGGLDVYNASQTCRMTATNLTSNFAQGYYVIAYMTGSGAGTGSITDDTTTHYFNFDNTGVEALVTSTSSSNYEEGNYVVFGSQVAPLTADTFRVSVSGGSTGVLGIGGFQIVAVPEPATGGLLAIFGIGLIAVRRRMRL